MTEPTREAKTTPNAEPADGGAVWALLVGGAILVIAGLLIFWPAGDTATETRGGAGKPGSGQQASHTANGDGQGGLALGGGVGAREYDPARGAQGRIREGLVPSGSGGLSMAPPPKPKAEPTSFPSAQAEIAHYEKKLEQARYALEQRTLFWTRMQKNLEREMSPQARQATEQRSVIVKKNYDDATALVQELEEKVKKLKEKAGTP